MYNRVFKSEQIKYGSPYQITYKKAIKDTLVAETGYQYDDNCVNYRHELSYDEDSDIENQINERAEIILESARIEAKKIVDAAKAEAILIFENANKEANEKKAKTTEEAWKEGYDRGVKAAESEYEEKIKKAEIALEKTLDECQILLAGMESEIISLSVAIAQKVLDKEIMTDKDYILHLAKCAISKCSDKNNIILKVSNEDYDHITKNKERLLALLDGVDDLEIKQGYSLKKGNCIINTPLGDMNASIDKRLQNIEETFQELYENGEAR